MTNYNDYFANYYDENESYFEGWDKPTLRTNFDIEDELHYKAALYEYILAGGNKQDIWIEDIAFDRHGTLLVKDKSLHSNKGDMGKFWRIFDKIKEKFPTRTGRFLLGLDNPK